MLGATEMDGVWLLPVLALVALLFGAYHVGKWVQREQAGAADYYAEGFDAGKEWGFDRCLTMMMDAPPMAEGLGEHLDY